MRPFWKWFGLGATAVLGLAALVGMVSLLATGRAREGRLVAVGPGPAGNPMAGDCSAGSAVAMLPGGGLPPGTAVVIDADGNVQAVRLAAGGCAAGPGKAAARLQAEQAQRLAQQQGVQAKLLAAHQAELAQRQGVAAAPSALQSADMSSASAQATLADGKGIAVAMAEAKRAGAPALAAAKASGATAIRVERGDGPALVRPMPPARLPDRLLAAALLGLLLAGGGVLLLRGMATGLPLAMPDFGFRPRGRGGRPAPAETGIQCPSCHREVSRDWATCPHCGYRKYLAPDLVERRCPTCGTTVQPDWKACPYCSTLLEPPVEAPAPGPADLGGDDAAPPAP